MDIRPVHRLRYIAVDDLSYGNIWKSIGIVMPIAAIAMFLLRHNEQAKGTLGLIVVVSAVLLLHFFDRRELRRREER
jgi:multidrug transporter EmrE-like cation transporter